LPARSPDLTLAEILPSITTLVSGTKYCIF
jgi:hypothetical protein